MPVEVTAIGVVKMKDVIEKLLKSYYEIAILINDVVVSEHKGRTTINIFKNLAPAKWHMYVQGTISSSTGLGELDLQSAERILDQERKRIADQIYDISMMVIKQQSIKRSEDMLLKWNQQYTLTPPVKGSDGHEKVINYSLGALFYLDVITPFEYDVTEPGFDESGVLMYMKQLPKKKGDEIEEMLAQQQMESE
jgi:hypothetical protein